MRDEYMHARRWFLALQATAPGTSLAKHCDRLAIRLGNPFAGNDAAPAVNLAGACPGGSSMGAFELMGGEYEQVVYCHDHLSGLKAIIAIHSTALGPALGGTRFYPYATEADALRDVFRLARGMSYKAAAAGLDLGGGKAVIIGDPKRIDRK